VKSKFTHKDGPCVAPKGAIEIKVKWAKILYTYVEHVCQIPSKLDTPLERS
jgi:hypothetical protein